MASLLTEGTPIRLTGQDTERGTFSQRHLVLHDVTTGRKVTPMQQLPGAQASFEVYNSPLSELAAIGFEYGYSAAAPEVLRQFKDAEMVIYGAILVLCMLFLPSGRRASAQI